MKKIVRLTENDLHGIIRQIINEIGYRAATLTAGANMKANHELANGRIYNKKRRTNMTKMDDSAKLKVISHSVIDNIGVFKLYFRKPEKEGYLSSLVTFTFNEIIYLDANEFIMQGFTEMSKHPVPSSKYRPKPRYAQIEYNFQPQEFREVVYCANGTIRKHEILKLIEGEGIGTKNKEIADKLILHMSNCMYSIEDYQSNVK
jgi:hypothetical protein